MIFYFRARFFNSGCTDAFTAFAFLAFLLALLDLILELQSGNFNAFPKLFFFNFLYEISNKFTLTKFSIY